LRRGRKFAAANGVWYRKRIASESIDVLENERGQSGDIIRLHRIALCLKLLESGIDVVGLHLNPGLPDYSFQSLSWI